MENKSSNTPNDAPQEFVNLMADWMVEHGPDRHCDGHDVIAKLTWNYFIKRTNIFWCITECIEEMKSIKHPPGCEGTNWDCPGCAIEGRLKELKESLEA